MRTSWIATIVAAEIAAAAAGHASQSDRGWTREFSTEKAEFASVGRNPYFVLEPGHRRVLEDGDERLVITVLSATKTVDGVETRVVEERETKAGAIVEVSRNYFAISRRTNSVFYFGEDVDMYTNGKVTSHEGSWISGVNGARFGLMIPGLPLLGARYHEEVAPGVAMDRGEIVGMGGALQVPAGSFRNVIRIEETTPLESGQREYKLYAAGVGLLQDGTLKLVRQGMENPGASP
jgi:hypothetical protein